MCSKGSDMFFSLFSVGEGSFGRVLQAKAEGIVPGMPDRNVVAVKTTKGTKMLRDIGMEVPKHIETMCSINKQ